MKYDYLIVGAGLFGAVFAEQVTKKGRKVLVIDRRRQVGGNCYTEDVRGIMVHHYGPHIFHTKSGRIWEYVNQFSYFYPYNHRVKANWKGILYSFPINLTTFYQLWGIDTPEKARLKLMEIQRPVQGNNLEDHALSVVGEEIYEKFIYGYTKKQWGRDPKELPSSFVKRLPIRLNFDDSYYQQPQYQGIPVEGYTPMVQRMLVRADLAAMTDFKSIADWRGLARKLIYTGSIDEFYDYQLGKLEYRTLDFESELHQINDYQGIAQINFTEEDIPYTRKIEFKHFTPNSQVRDETIVTREVPSEWNETKERFYPIPNERNVKLYREYTDLASLTPGIIFAGRLGKYRYLDMDQVIGSALTLAKRETE